MEKSRLLAANVLKAATRQTRELRDHVEQLTLFSAEQRVGRFLLQMRLHASPNRKDLTLPFDKALVAAYLGIKPETFSRTLQFFKEKGFVIERSHLSAPSREALCAYCDSFTAHTCRSYNASDCLYAAKTRSVV